VIEILTGRDSGWNAQRRSLTDTAWSEAWQVHWKHMLFGIVTAVIAYLISPTLFLWLTPTLAGLLLCIPLAKISGSVMIGRALQSLRLLLTPEETSAPAIMRRRDELLAQIEPVPDDGIRFLATHRQARLAHITGNLPRPNESRGHPDPHRLTAERKVLDAATLQEALSWLSPPERVHVAGDPRLLERLAELPEA
jgi:membrane glycosyltransferase